MCSKIQTRGIPVCLPQPFKSQFRVSEQKYVFIKMKAHLKTGRSKMWDFSPQQFNYEKTF